MITLLAQTDPEQSVRTTVWWLEIHQLARPAELLPRLESAHPVVGCIALVVGIALLLYGFWLYKGLIILTAGYLGWLIGSYYGAEVEWPIVCGIFLAVCLAMLAYQFLRLSVSLMFGVLVASIAAVPLQAQNPHPVVFWAVVIVVGLIAAVLMFFFFNLLLVLYTSANGATIALLAAIALLLHVSAVAPKVHSLLDGRPMLIPILIVVLSFIGSVVQISLGALGKRRKPAGAYTPK